MIDIKHKETKEQRGIFETKVTSDLKVATKPCGCLIIELCLAKLCGLCSKQPCCSLYLPSANKELCFFVSLCLKSTCVTKI